MHNNKFAVSASLFVTGGSGYLGSCFLGRINASMFDKIYCLVRDRVPVFEFRTWNSCAAT